MDKLIKNIRKFEIINTNNLVLFKYVKNAAFCILNMAQKSTKTYLKFHNFLADSETFAGEE